MPTPYFLARPSGLYVRFLVPQDLRHAIGSRFLLRPLGVRQGDEARFVASYLAVALSKAFARMRTGDGMVDIKKVLESALRVANDGTQREWTATGVKVGGIDFGNVTTKGPQDTQDFIKTMQAAAAIGRARSSLDGPTRSAPTHPSFPLLSVEIAHHIGDLERRKLATDTITESKHSLRFCLT